MKAQIPVTEIKRVRAIGTGMLAEVEMTENQMFATLLGFLDRVSDDTWAQWQDHINTVIYGKPNMVTT